MTNQNHLESIIKFFKYYVNDQKFKINFFVVLKKKKKKKKKCKRQAKRFTYSSLKHPIIKERHLSTGLFSVCFSVE